MPPRGSIVCPLRQKGVGRLMSLSMMTGRARLLGLLVGGLCDVGNSSLALPGDSVTAATDKASSRFYQSQAAPLSTAAGGPTLSRIVIENQRPGVPWDVWDLTGGTSDPNIQGFTTDVSVRSGGTVEFKINTLATAYEIRIYRIGWYGGLGAAEVATVLPSVPLPQEQPACELNPVDCSKWKVSATWTHPEDRPSGVYVARLVRTDGTASSGSHIVFVVRDDERRSEVLFQTSDTTWQAYNPYPTSTNTSLYNGAVRVGYDRPITTRDFTAGNSFFGAEYHMVRWLERNGYDVSYTTGVDTARQGSEIIEHRVFLSVGHDEYWSSEQRANVEAARDAGVHLAFFSGNEVFWKTRWESQHRTMVCYKETTYDAPEPPDGAPEFTGTWRDARDRSLSDPPRPENALTGTIFGVSGTAGRRIVVPAADGDLRLWRGTAAESAPACGVTVLADQTLGFEWDHDEDNGFRPPGLFRLSTTSAHRAPVMYGPGTHSAGGFFNNVSGLSTHHVTLYRHSSGSLVFGAGTVQWSWGLDANHLSGSNDLTMQQATVNLFADMGVQPGTLQGDLAPATPSSDSSPPVSTITAPSPGASVRYGTAVTITGQATDSGGRVAGIEVSVDGGVSWRRADGRDRFRYVWMASTAGPVVLSSRAVDDSGNIESAGRSIPVQVDCSGPCSLWSPSDAPISPLRSDGDPVEIGIRFRSEADGYLEAVRFYKHPDNSGPHTGHLWTADGVLLATVEFTNETQSGWQRAAFSSPVPIAANATYIASYYTETGYARDIEALAARGVYSPPLRALRSGGVYGYGSNPTFPTRVFRSPNYWVDVEFTPTQSHPRSFWNDAAPVQALKPDQRSVEVGLRFRSESDSYVTGIRFYKGPGNTGTHVVNLWAPTPPATTPPSGGGGLLLGSATSLSETGSGWQTVTFSNPIPIYAGVEYVASYHTSTGYAQDEWYFSAGPLHDPPLWALDSVYRYDETSYPTTNFRNSNYWVEPILVPTASFARSLWDSDPTPATAHNADGNREVELGVRFKTEVSGYVTGVRFYKHPENSGPRPHEGSLWDSGGNELASTLFVDESACGWQTAAFPQPVPVSAGQTYVASYHTWTGYAQDHQYFEYSLLPSGLPRRGVWNPPLRAPASGEPREDGNGLEGPNGLYRYGPRAFPDKSCPPDKPCRASNYWVDIVFMTRPTSSAPSPSQPPGPLGLRTDPPLPLLLDPVR